VSCPRVIQLVTCAEKEVLYELKAYYFSKSPIVCLSI